MLLKLGKGTSACVLAIVEEWQHRSTEEMFLSVGARIGYFQGDVKKLVDDIATLRPTLFIGTIPYHYRPCCQKGVSLVKCMSCTAPGQFICHRRESYA